MEAKDAKDLTKTAKDKKDKKKNDYDKLSEAEKQAIRDEQIAKAVKIIDSNITDAANSGTDRIFIPKNDALIRDMDAKAIEQLLLIYTTPGQGGEYFECSEDASCLRFSWLNELNSVKTNGQ
jgi:hypothetical protein